MKKIGRKVNMTPRWSLQYSFTLSCTLGCKTEHNLKISLTSLPTKVSRLEAMKLREVQFHRERDINFTSLHRSWQLTISLAIWGCLLSSEVHFGLQGYRILSLTTANVVLVGMYNASFLDASSIKVSCLFSMMCQSSACLVNLFRVYFTSWPVSAGIISSSLWFFYKKSEFRCALVERMACISTRCLVYVCRVLLIITSVIYTVVSITLSFWCIKSYIECLKQLHCNSKIFACVSACVTEWVFDLLVPLWWMSTLIVPKQHPLSHLCDIVHMSAVSVRGSTLSSVISSPVRSLKPAS